VDLEGEIEGLEQVNGGEVVDMLKAQVKSLQTDQSTRKAENRKLQTKVDKLEKELAKAKTNATSSKVKEPQAVSASDVWKEKSEIAKNMVSNLTTQIADLRNEKTNRDKLITSLEKDQ
jgi:peptidoglycan hydrolase CwlO-like protein